VLGLTPATTAAGLEHVDGSACAITSEHFVAIAEERVSRVAHAGGSEFSLRAVLGSVGRAPGDVDRWVLSTCGEPAIGRPGERVLGSALQATLHDMGVDPDRIAWSPSHHLSHARSAAVLAAPGDLIAVVDDAGSEDATTGQAERASLYLVGDHGALSRVALVAAPPPGGVGSLYRSVTTQIGFSGETECGKTMALAAFPTPVCSPGGLTGADPMLAASDSAESVARTLSGRSDFRWAFAGRYWGNEHVAAAKAAQAAVEHGLLTWLGTIVDRLRPRPRRLLLTGGVALNCRAMGRLWAELPLDVVVHHAPGDTGQAVGNALIAARDLGVVTPPGADSMFTGPDPTPEQFDGGLRASALQRVQSMDRVAAVAEIGRRLDSGEVVGLFEGRSEFGPRALGHRSILADPRRADRALSLNARKRREPFRPFGLAVRPEDAGWLVGRDVVSPSMLLALSAAPEALRRAPAGIHVDGTTRMQTVAPEVGLLHEILGCWRNATGVPVLINTSFNPGGEPIVETPAEAVDAAVRLALDLVVLVDGDRVTLADPRA